VDAEKIPNLVIVPNLLFFFISLLLLACFSNSLRALCIGCFPTFLISLGAGEWGDASA
jgi:hypothetical protein